MPKHVPEALPPSPAEQLQWLRDRLTGHRAFARVRGRLMESFIGVVDRAIERDESPTSFCDQWDRLASDVRVVGNLLVQLRRDGWSAAADDLYRSLCYSGEYITGETIPLDATTPITILMLEPVKTIAVIKWIRAGRTHDLERYLDGKPIHHNPALVQALFAHLPDLRRSIEKARKVDHWCYGYEVWFAYSDAVIDSFSDLRSTLEEKGGRFLFIASETYDNSLEVEDIALAYVFAAAQDEVLSWFDRETQARLATWQCRVPTVHVEETHLESVVIGFFPEQRRGDWKDHPAIALSAGAQQGLVLAAMHGRSAPQAFEFCSRYNKLYEENGVIVDDLTSDSPFAFVLRV